MQIVEQLNTALADRYRIDGEIGSGGMAIVYRAHDIRHDRSVALKVLNPELGALLGPTRFLAEIRVTANLQHPNLLPLFDSGEANGLLFYVMPYVEGESLRSRLTRERQLPIDEAVHIAASVAGALEYAHVHGVIHRDLKPENILMQAGQPMVADFGIALAVKKAGGERITHTGISIGTPQYMSPEQATGDRVIDGRSDIYSLAAVLYEMLTGDPPHTGNTLQSIVAKVLVEDVPSVRVTRPNVPEHIAHAISRGLEKLPADRWSSARAFGDALSGGRPSSASEAPAPVSRRWPTVAPRRRAIVLGSICTALGVGLGVTIASWPRSQPRGQLSWVDLALPDSTDPQPVGTITRQRLQEGVSAVTERFLAISRDGSVIAYTGSATQSLFVRPLDELSSRRVVGTEGAQCPSFSPDGRWIVFVSTGRLKKVAVRGGSPIVIADSAGRCGIWTDRNDIVYDFRGELFRVSADGGPVSVVTRSDTSKLIGQMVPGEALPGSNAALISVTEQFNQDWQLGLVSLPGGQITKLTRRDGIPRYSPAYANGYLVFGQSGGIVAVPFSLRTLTFTGPEVTLLQDTIVDFATAENGSLAYMSSGRGSLTLVAVGKGGKPRTLGGNAEGSPLRASAVTALDTAWFSWPRLSPDGKRIAVELRTGPFTWDIWVYDLVSRTLSRLTSNFTGIRPAGWTADGRSVVFMAIDSTSLDAPRRLVSQPWDGTTPPREIMPLPRNVHDVSVGPPHGYAASTMLRPGKPSDIWLTPLDTPSAARPLVATGASEGMPRLSRDGKLLAYISNETGRSEVYVRSLLGAGSRLQVSAGGGTQPAWSLDGRQLYYRGPGYMMRAMIARGSEVSVTQRDTLFRDVFVPHNMTNYDVFPGGQELLMIRAHSGAVRAAIVLNWPELLRQRAALR